MTTDEKLDLILDGMQNMQSDIKEIQSDVKTLKWAVENLDQRLTSIEQRMTDIEKRVTDIEERVTHIEERVTDIEEQVADIGQRVTNIELSMENEIRFSLQLLAENHSNLIDKLNQAVKVSDKNMVLEVQMLNFRMRLEKLESAFSKFGPQAV